MNDHRCVNEALTDRAWHSYDGRAMAPAFAVVALASLLLLAGRWLLDDLSHLAEHIGSLVLYTLVALMWALLLATWLYRSVTYTYRLTSRALVVDRGFRWPAAEPVWFDEVRDVTVAASLLGRRLGVGSVAVHTATGRRVEMRGVADPEAFAAEIRRAVNESKA